MYSLAIQYINFGFHIIPENSLNVIVNCLLPDCNDTETSVLQGNKEGVGVFKEDKDFKTLTCFLSEWTTGVCGLS